MDPRAAGLPEVDESVDRPRYALGVESDEFQVGHVVTDNRRTDVCVLEAEVHVAERDVLGMSNEDYPTRSRMRTSGSFGVRVNAPRPVAGPEES